MEAVNGKILGGEGPPPPSPLTGCYLLVVIAEPFSKEHKDNILQRVAKGLLSWDSNDCLVDLEKELHILINQNLQGDATRYGERLIQFASENLVTEILFHPAVSTLSQCVRNLLSSFTRHRHIIHAGYAFQGNGSWALQDGTFSYLDFVEIFQDFEVQRVIHAYEDKISLDLHCFLEGDWIKLPQESFTKTCKVRINPMDVLTTGSSSICNFIKYLSSFLLPTTLDCILLSSDIVGNIRFSRPTLYIFPGGQGDAALFGINGFNMLFDGGYSRKACFWDFVRHLDRLDAVLVSRLNNNNINGIQSLLQRKKEGAAYPQIGHFFCNIQERNTLLSPDGDKDKNPLILSLFQEAQSMLKNLQFLNLSPQPCYRESDPIILYHKVGHGTLNMYIISPDKNSRDVREFLQKWESGDSKLFVGTRHEKDFNFPLSNLTSICALLVWQPANPEENITRILYTGSTTQKKIFEGLEKIKNLEYIKHPICNEKQLYLSEKIKHDIKEKAALKDKLESKKKTENIIVIEDALKNIKLEKETVERPISKSGLLESKKEKKKNVKNGEETNKMVDNVEKAKIKMKANEYKPLNIRSENQQRKKLATDKKGSPTPKKVLENKSGREPKDTKLSKSAPSRAPPKSTKDANNRKVVENKIFKSELLSKTLEEMETKSLEGKSNSLSPKTVHRLPSPTKKMTKEFPNHDSLLKRGRLDKEGTTDSSTVSTPSTDQEIILKRTVSKQTPDENFLIDKHESQELNEEQEAIREIEAVFRKTEKVILDSKPDIRKIKNLSIDDKLESEEYLIIEKEELENYSFDQEIKEGEIHKLTRDSEESEKQKNLSEDEEKSPVKDKSGYSTTDQASKKITEKTKNRQRIIISPEEKSKKDVVDEQILESHQEEKVSATAESAASTTAPTLPEDERIALDEIKESNEQATEEKYVKEETKEKDIPVILTSEFSIKSPQESQSKVPPTIGIALDKQKHIRDIVKTPDEVADLPVHEEADYQEYQTEEKKNINTEINKEHIKAHESPREEHNSEICITKNNNLSNENVAKENNIAKHTRKECTQNNDKHSTDKGHFYNNVVEKADVETKEKLEQVINNLVEKELENEELTNKNDSIISDKQEKKQCEYDEIKKQKRSINEDMHGEDEIPDILEKDNEDIKILIEEADSNALIKHEQIKNKEEKDVTSSVKFDVNLEGTMLNEKETIDQKESNEMPIVIKHTDAINSDVLQNNHNLDSEEEKYKPKKEMLKTLESTEKAIKSDCVLEGDHLIFKEQDISKAELGSKSPAEREEDVKKIVASVAEVLKSEASLEKLQEEHLLTHGLKETHISTQESSEQKELKTQILSNKTSVFDKTPVSEAPKIPDDKTLHNGKCLLNSEDLKYGNLSKDTCDEKNKIDKTEDRDDSIVPCMLSSKDGRVESNIFSSASSCKNLETVKNSLSDPTQTQEDKQLSINKMPSAKEEIIEIEEKQTCNLNNNQLEDVSNVSHDKPFLNEHIEEEIFKVGNKMLTDPVSENNGMDKEIEHQLCIIDPQAKFIQEFQTTDILHTTQQPEQDLKEHLNINVITHDHITQPNNLDETSTKVLLFEKETENIFETAEPQKEKEKSPEMQHPETPKTFLESMANEKDDKCLKFASQIFLENEREVINTILDETFNNYIPESAAFCQIDTKSTSENLNSITSDKIAPIVSVSNSTKDISKSPSLKLESGLSEQTETDDEDFSTKSQIAHSQSDLEELNIKIDPINVSTYGALSKEIDEMCFSETYLYEITKAKYVGNIELNNCNSDFSKNKEDLQRTNYLDQVPLKSPCESQDNTSKNITSELNNKNIPVPSYLYEITKAKYSLGTAENKLFSQNVQKTHDEKEINPNMTSPNCEVLKDDDYDPTFSWGKPLELPSPTPPNYSDKGTPKKEKQKLAYIAAKNKLNDDKKKSEMTSKLLVKKSAVYVDLTYVPHHGNYFYSYLDFFKKIRARYYVFSGLEPKRKIYDALLEAKQTWEDPDLEVTIIPTYDTDELGLWVAENEELLSKYKIDLSPSASRCTINLQDHETCCSAYRLEF